VFKLIDFVCIMLLQAGYFSHGYYCYIIGDCWIIYRNACRKFHKAAKYGVIEALYKIIFLL